MTPAEARYAVYFVPAANSALYRFGASVLGYDCYLGKEIPLIEGAPELWGDFVQEPQKYGFHGTLKAPFRLTEGQTEHDLLRALRNFSPSQQPVPRCALELRELGSFIALTPKNPPGALGRLAQACVEEFDRFRAPMNEKERARRLASKLTPRQIEYLDRWGYPYVFEEFRFHLTLTGSLESEARSRAFGFLCEKFKQMPALQSFVIDQIAVFRQLHGNARFEVIGTAPL